MAVSYASGYSNFGNGVPQPASVTVAAWIRTTTVAAGQGQFICRDNVGGTGTRIFQFRRNGNKLDMVSFGTAGPYTAAGTTVLSINTWYHVAGVYNAGTNTSKVYLGGVEDGTVATAGNLRSGTRDWVVGAATNGAGFTNFLSGSIFLPAQWDGVLTVAEIAQLATGASPLKVNPTLLSCFAPCWGRYTETDIVGGITATDLNKSAADNPRVFMPRRRSVIAAPAAVGGFKSAFAAGSNVVMQPGVCCA